MFFHFSSDLNLSLFRLFVFYSMFCYSVWFYSFLFYPGFCWSWTNSTWTWKAVKTHSRVSGFFIQPTIKVKDFDHFKKVLFLKIVLFAKIIQHKPTQFMTKIAYMYYAESMFSRYRVVTTSRLKAPRHLVGCTW